MAEGQTNRGAVHTVVLSCMLQASHKQHMSSKQFLATDVFASCEESLLAQLSGCVLSGVRLAALQCRCGCEIEIASQSA